MKILVVEDDSRLRRLVCGGLQDVGLRTESAADRAEACLKLALGAYDVIVMDVILPDGNGLDICRAMRDEGDMTPVLFLTALGEEDERVEGFARGGDDYLTKPFSFRELVARIQALARRPAALLPEIVQLADLTVELSSRRVVRGGREIELTPQEFVLLEYLVRHEGRAANRAEIMAYVWDDNHDPFSNVLEVLVWRLRRKIDDGFEPTLIHTVRGVGYRLGLP